MEVQPANSSTTTAAAMAAPTLHWTRCGEGRGKSLCMKKFNHGHESQHIRHRKHLRRRRQR
jgi:hypothetical protein